MRLKLIDWWHIFEATCIVILLVVASTIVAVFMVALVTHLYVYMGLGGPLR